MREQGKENARGVRDDSRREEKRKKGEDGGRKKFGEKLFPISAMVPEPGSLGEDIGIRELDHVINCRPSIGRSPPPLSFYLPVKIIIRKAISHTEFVKNDFHRARIPTGKSCCKLGLEI